MHRDHEVECWIHKDLLPKNPQGRKAPFALKPPKVAIPVETFRGRDAIAHVLRRNGVAFPFVEL